MRARLRCLAAAIGVLLTFGCATGSGHSGFLGDYSALRPGAGGGPRLVYLDADVDFSGYEGVIVEPVMVWKSDEARFAGVPASQREALASEFEAALERALAKEFQLVEAAPGPGTLRVRNALTAAIAGPETSGPRRLQYIEVQLELLDAVTKERLAAAVDSKGSDPSRPDQLPHVVEAGAAFEDWAERLAVRLAALRAVDRNQQQPEAESEWNQARVAALAQDLIEPLEALGADLGSQPPVPEKEALHAALLNDVKGLQLRAKELAQRLASGAGRVETDVLFRELQTLESQAARRSLKYPAPFDMHVYIDRVQSITLQLARYYGGSSTGNGSHRGHER